MSKAIINRLERLEGNRQQIVIVLYPGESERQGLDRHGIGAVPPRADLVFVHTGVPEVEERHGRNY